VVVRGRLDPPQLQDRWLADHPDAGHRHRVSRRGGVPSSRPRGHLGRVIVKLKNHAAGGVTDKDFELARKIEEVVLWRPAAGGAPEGAPNKVVRARDPPGGAGGPPPGGPPRGGFFPGRSPRPAPPPPP